MQIATGKRAPRAALAALALSAVALVAVGPAATGAFAQSAITLGPNPTLSASPGSVNFGNMTLGDFSDPVTVTFKNTSPVTDTITRFVLGGIDPDDFTYDGTSCGQLITQASCTVDVSFLPGALGPRQATLTPVDSSTTPPSVTLSGTGTEGYLETTARGVVHTFGDAQSFGDTSGIALKSPIVTMETTGDNGGYWLVASDGGIFAFGDATFFGSAGGIRLNKPVVGMAETADEEGYWEVASDGGIFSYGDAPFYGSTGGITLNKPVVGMAATLDGGGYWLVASDGGIFAFGDAPFYGSTGAIALNKPIVGMAVTPDGGGYWLVASDGGIFAFGDAAFYGSTGSLALSQPIVGMTPTPDGEGYWLVAADGGIFNFGDAPFYGSSQNGSTDRTVAMAESGYFTFQAASDQPALRLGAQVRLEHPPSTIADGSMRVRPRERRVLEAQEDQGARNGLALGGVGAFRMSCPTTGSQASVACSEKSSGHWSCTTMLVALGAWSSPDV